jgi:hypothetical protein
MRLAKDILEFVELLNSNSVEYPLLKNKRSTGRPKDLIDAAEIERMTSVGNRPE